MNEKFNILNQNIRHISECLAENEIAEDPLLKRNAIEVLAAISPPIAAKMMDLRDVLSLEFGLMVGLPISAISLVSYFKTVRKRTPYQEESLLLGNFLNEACKDLRKQFPDAQWDPKKGCYELPEKPRKAEPRVSTVPKIRYSGGMLTATR